MGKSRVKIASVARSGGLAAIVGLSGSLIVYGQSQPPRRAMPASPHPVAATQPDGTRIILYLRGDESLHWQEDANGYPVVRSPDGRYVYAVVDSQGRLQATKRVVGQGGAAAAGIQKVRPNAARKRMEPAASDPMGKPGPRPDDPMGGECEPHPNAAAAGTPSPADDPMGDATSPASATGGSRRTLDDPMGAGTSSQPASEEHPSPATPAGKVGPQPDDDDPMGDAPDPDSTAP